MQSVSYFQIHGLIKIFLFPLTTEMTDNFELGPKFQK